jgi:hypothetical protein
MGMEFFALVAEVRQLRKDLQITNASALKAQILLSRLQAQEATVQARDMPRNSGKALREKHYAW